MKYKLIKILALLIILLITGFDNNLSNSNCKVQGTIIGYDINRCTCCGGYKIQIGERIFLTDSIQKGILKKGPVFDQSKYPVKVFLDYKYQKYCSSMRIIITCMKKR